MIKRLFGVVLAIGLVFGSGGCFSAEASPAPLATLDFNIVGLTLKASPEYQAVPKGIATQVNTAFDAGGFDVTAIADKLPRDYTVRAELTGPAFPTPKTLVTRPGAPFDIPTLALLGKYTLSNIRLVDGTGTILFAAVPQAVTIESVDDVLITGVSTRELTREELEERGVTFDASNFTAYEFTAALATESGQIDITLPVAVPNDEELVNPEDILSPSEIGIPQQSVNQLPPPAPQTRVPQNLMVAPFMMKVEQQEGEPTVELPPIPGVVVIPGNIGFLHQFFSALALVTNGAPGQSNLVLHDLQAKILFPPGEDLTEGTDAVPGDDPLRMAKGAAGFFPRSLPVMHAGPDGRFGSADDISRLYPAESGQADFTIEGLKEGTHKLDFEITFAVGPSAVTEASRLFSKRMESDEELVEIIEKIIADLRI